jgi:hypothetical protein
MPRMTTRWRLLLVAGFVLLGLGVWSFRPIGQPFDPVAWQDPVRVKQGVRLAMADRLVAKGTMLGKTRSQVVRSLGEPSGEGYFKDWDLVYWLGPERGFICIDSEWLVLRLGGNGQVVESRIVRD